MLSRSLRRFAGTALAALALSTAACGSDNDTTGPDTTGPGTPPADVSGTYSLVRVRTLGNLGGGGNSLPVTFTDGGGSSLSFTGGQLVLAQDGSYTLEVDAEFNGGDVTMSDEGNYEMNGSSIAFDPTGSPERMESGTINGNAMTARTQFGGIPFEIDLSK
jgi:hypothetical protein